MTAQQQQFKDPVFYTPANNGRVPSIIDTAAVDAAGEFRGHFSKETLAQLSLRYPGVAIGEYDAVVADKEAMLITAPSEITEEVFNDALEVLPPQGYAANHQGTSFKMLEHLSGRITSVYARVGKAFYTFNDICTISHDAVVDKVLAFKQASH